MSTNSTNEPLTDMDMTWLDDLPPAPPAPPRRQALKSMLNEFESAGPNVFLRSILIDGVRYLAIGTWVGTHGGRHFRVNAAPGAFKSLVAASETLVEESLTGEDGPTGQYRIWLLRHVPNMPIKMWVAVVGGANLKVIYYRTSADGYTGITGTEWASITRGRAS